jgi:hypothetical protein
MLGVASSNLATPTNSHKKRNFVKHKKRKKSYTGGCYVIAPSYEECFELWLDLLEYCRRDSKDKDSKVFKSKQDNINRIYKRMDYREQGEYHRLIHESHPKPNTGP